MTEPSENFSTSIRRMPLLVEAMPGESSLDLLVHNNRASITRQLLDHGAILFRGFGVTDADAFRRFVDALALPSLDYRYRSTPRSSQGRDVYTATEYPKDREIPLHNENAYQRRWPRTLAFCCVCPASVGGATPLADMREVRARLDPAIFDSFARLGVRYDRVFQDLVDLPWQEAFQTEDPAAVERYCREQDIQYEWLEENVLCTSQRCPGVVRHAQLDEEFFFNQAHLFHPSALGETTLQHLLDAFGEDRLPRNACYGNGEPIPAATLTAVRAAFAAAAVDLDWRQGDVALIDNLQVAHGRRSYQGDRLILAALMAPNDTAAAQPDACAAQEPAVGQLA